MSLSPISISKNMSTNLYFLRRELSKSKAVSYCFIFAVRVTFATTLALYAYSALRYFDCTYFSYGLSVMQYFVFEWSKC